MARFFATAVNSRGNTVEIGGRGAGAGEIHLRGWDAGVKVVPVKLPDGDAFDVYMTTGSNHKAHDVLLGRVTLLQGFDKPVFVPEA